MSVTTSSFQVATGSVIGKEHYRMRTNCQDAFHLACTESALVAVVCDGCSSGRYSEVGAQLGARFLAGRISQVAADDSAISFADTLESVRIGLLEYLSEIAGGLGCLLSQAVHDYFLFTVVGVVMTRFTTYFFSLGDGMFAVNGSLTHLGPFPDNAPPYLAYALCENPFQKEDLDFNIDCILPTHEVSTFALGTDGVADLIKGEANTLPGGSSVVGPLSQFWCDDIYFRNPAALGNRLRAINTDLARVNWQARSRTIERGLLPDDTTLVVGRRTPVSTSNSWQNLQAKDGETDG